MSKTSTELGGIGPISCKEKLKKSQNKGLKLTGITRYIVFENLRKSLIWFFHAKNIS